MDDRFSPIPVAATNYHPGARIYECDCSGFADAGGAAGNQDFFLFKIEFYCRFAHDSSDQVEFARTAIFRVNQGVAYYFGFFRDRHDKDYENFENCSLFT